jgi:hypothetical protein
MSTTADPRPELAIALALALASTRPLSARLDEWYAGRSFDPTEPEVLEHQSSALEGEPIKPSRANVIDLDVARRSRRRHQRIEAQVNRKDTWS